MSQLHDDTKLTAAELIRETPYYVVRLLSGARVMEKWTDEPIVEIASDGEVWVLKEAHYQTVKAVTDEVSKLCAVQGIHHPHSVETFNKIHKFAAWAAEGSVRTPAHKLRVLFVLDPEHVNACAFYRVIQPAQWFEKIQDKSPVKVELTSYVQVGMSAAHDYDCVVIPRPSNLIAKMARDLIAGGKVVVYETDDLLTDLPVFNPARMWINANQWYHAFIQKAHGRIVSTEQLAEQLNVPDHTYVVHNGIDPSFWPMKVPEQPAQGQPVRVLWAGSNTHQGDLALIIDPIRRCIKNYQSRVQFVFIGYLPAEFQDRFDANRVEQSFRKWVEYIPPVGVFQWPEYVAKAKCHVALAPLVKHAFNDSKSEVKWMEACALGLPIICSDAPPYRRAISDGVDGYIVGNTPADWEARLSTLILSAEKRVAMGAAGIAALKTKGYLMEDLVLVMEKAILQICKGRIGRPECELAIVKRLQELEG